MDVPFAYGLSLFLHLMGFALWLGGEVGLWRTGRQLAAGLATPPARRAAADTLLWLAWLPLLCLVVTPLVGYTLADVVGVLDTSPGWIAATWVVFGAWLALAVTLVRRQAVTRDAWPEWLHFAIGALMVPGFLYEGVMVLRGASAMIGTWLGLKLLAYGLLVALSLVRLRAVRRLDREIQRDEHAPDAIAAIARAGGAIAWSSLAGAVLVTFAAAVAAFRVG